MLGKDIDSSLLSFRTWIVDGSPDFSGSLYNGPKAGEHDFTEVSAYIIPDGYQVDHHIPEPFLWTNTKRVLPAQAAKSAFAIITDGYDGYDGYSYLFGGIDSDKILRASLHDPCLWEELSFMLPNKLHSSCFARIGDEIYLFGGAGGVDGYTATDEILMATAADPLNWEVVGNLPTPIYDQTLFIYDGYIYLVGGRTNISESIIWKASINDPTTWTVSLSSLPDRLAGTAVALVDGYAYLFGGDKDGIAQSYVCRAHLSSPETWVSIGLLPYPMAYGQALIIANKLYLYGNSQIVYSEFNFEMNMWKKSNFEIPGETYQASFGVIRDQLFFFGGNGNTSIYASDILAKFNYRSGLALSYAARTRTALTNSPNRDTWFGLLGMAPWATDFHT